MATAVQGTANGVATTATAATTSTNKGSKFPPWQTPTSTPAEPARFSVFNSLTGRVVEFLPIHPPQVSAYICGPTVYDVAHLGHARAYLTFDIIRRILRDYFHYDVFWVMNITDVDDKIIKRARQHFLVNSYEKKAIASISSLTTDKEKLGKFFADLFMTGENALHKDKSKLEQKKSDLEYELKAAVDEELKGELKEKLAEEALKQKQNDESLSKFNQLRSSFPEFSFSSSSSAIEFFSNIFSIVSSSLGDYLDALEGHTVSDPSIFKALTERYEREFFADMKSLNILDPDAITRVTEYLPEIIALIEKIEKNGYAYRSNGSVYFDTQAYRKGGNHYCKLTPWNASNTALVAEGEGALSEGKESEKRHPMDFALWKAKKPGEPVWSSPFGEGRPGWHIECSAMASDLHGERFDFHGGGVDLKFPHHDNEIAQSEAGFGCGQWVNYWLHAGHLHMEGLKMSKSLKNFKSIQETLKEFSPRVIRFLFLSSNWRAPMNFSLQALEEAKAKEKTLSEFFENMKVKLREAKELHVEQQKWTPVERNLHKALVNAQKRVDEHLRNDLSYEKAFVELYALVQETNRYIATEDNPKRVLLFQTTSYVHRMLKTFGAINSDDSAQSFGFVSSSSSSSSSSAPEDAVVNVAVRFRESVRRVAKEEKNGKLLSLCDGMRNGDMFELGIRIEDDQGKELKSVWKRGDAAAMKKERENAQKERLENELKKLDSKISSLEKSLSDLKEDSVSPKDYFAHHPNKKFAQFNAEGKPTHDEEGKELAKSAVKTMEKEWDRVEKKWKKYEEKIAKNPNLVQEISAELDAKKKERKTLAGDSSSSSSV